jgi:radical SAM-linked protein
MTPAAASGGDAVWTGGARPGGERRHWLVAFARTGPASYLSHLDTARALQRTFARAGIALALSEGFRPKPRFSLPLPLPVGAAGLDELCVVEVGDQAPAPAHALRALRAAAATGLMPLGLQACAVRPHPQAVAALYACELEVDEAPLRAAAGWFADQEHVTVERVSPKGRRTLDLAEYVKDLAVEAAPCGARVTFAVRHRSDGAARPQEVVDLLAGRAGCAPVMHRLTRLRVSYEGLPRDTVSGGEE